MIVLEESHQNLSDYTQFIQKSIWKKKMISGEKLTNASNSICDYIVTHFSSNALYSCIYIYETKFRKYNLMYIYCIKINTLTDTFKFSVQYLFYLFGTKKKSLQVGIESFHK